MPPLRLARTAPLPGFAGYRGGGLATRLGLFAQGLPNGLAHLAPPTLAGLLVVTVALDLFGETFFFAQLFEAFEHLLDAFVASRTNSQHRVFYTSSPRYQD